MTQINCIKNLLEIKDENIIFTDNCIEIKEFKKGVKTKIIHGLLTYTPIYCSKCKSVNENGTIIKWGYKRCKIKINKISNYNCLLELNKQRFLCKNCNQTFIAETSFVDFHKQISNNLANSIKQELIFNSSEKDIAFRNNVSVSSVNRILGSISDDKHVKMMGHLPEILGVDEFKGTKDTISKMSMIIVDHNKRNVFDVLNSRLSKDVEKYFRRYSYKERNKVKIITMDLYKPYYKLMHKLFPNAIIIPDRFHIVIQFRNALDLFRISLCKKSNPNYKKLKKYWKLILKKEEDLNKTNKTYSKCFKKEMTQYDIVTYLINTNEEFKELYNIYQGILKSINDRDETKFWNIIEHTNKHLPKKFRQAFNTCLNLKKYISNSFNYEYSNGIVEGINNVVKSIIKSAYGYRKFKHLKARIMLRKGYYSFA